MVIGSSWNNIIVNNLLGVRKMSRIFLPSGIKPVHSFDLWGVLVVQSVLGPRVLESYQELMDGQESPETIADRVRNYQGVLDGEAWALAQKKANVDTVEDALWPAYLRGEINVDFDGAIYQDALDVLDDIDRVMEGFSILTTGNSPWVRQALSSLNPAVGRALRRVYSGDKSKPEAYERAAEDIRHNGGRMVSHTEDQLKGLGGILQSDLRHSVKLVYVERTNLATPEQVREAGVPTHTRDLTEVPYAQMVQKQ